MLPWWALAMKRQWIGCLIDADKSQQKTRAHQKHFFDTPSLTINFKRYFSELATRKPICKSERSGKK